MEYLKFRYRFINLLFQEMLHEWTMCGSDLHKLNGSEALTADQYCLFRHLCRCQKLAGNSLVRHLIKAPLGNRDIFMKVFHAALLREVCHCMPISTEHPFCGQKPLQSHWASGVNPCCTDTNLSSCNMIKQKTGLTDFNNTL